MQDHTLRDVGCWTMQELMQYLCSGGEDTFECPNCLAKEHQCFYCKQDGVEQKNVFK